jgi:aminoglycoside phosphotransferase family enzyme
MQNQLVCPNVAQEPTLDTPLEKKVAFLSKPEAYPHAPSDVLVEETHMSWVFLAGDRVYKLKKPVAYAFLDFSTLERREFNCREEVRLNRRLAPDVYLGVISLVADGRGRLSLGGQGKIVDWLVEMRRLPAQRMLDAAIVNRRVTVGDIECLAERLIAFYRDADRSKLSGRNYVERMAHEHEINRSVLTDPRFDLERSKVDAAIARVDHILYQAPECLLRRAEHGRIVDGHGDLRPEHVCLEQPPVVIDCLEFNPLLRLVDPVDEIAFLGLECTMLGADWIGQALLGRYAAKSNDKIEADLARIYWTYRACLRARLSLMHIIEQDKRKPQKWLPLACRYIDLSLTFSIK